MKMRTAVVTEYDPRPDAKNQPFSRPSGSIVLIPDSEEDIKLALFSEWCMWNLDDNTDAPDINSMQFGVDGRMDGNPLGYFLGPKDWHHIRISIVQGHRTLGSQLPLDPPYPPWGHLGPWSTTD